MPLVSVIIPTCRRPKLCMRALEGVLAQTHGDFEVIVVVDGPNAETLELLKAQTDKRVKVIHNEISRGGPEARNIGVAAASGAWIAFLDDDDEWLPTKLERQLAMAGSPERAVVVTCLSHIVTPKTRFIWPRRIYDGTQPFDEYMFDRRSFFRGETFCQTTSIMMPRWLFNEFKFPSIHQHEDWDLLIKATKARHAEVVTVPEALVIIHTEEQRESLSATFKWRPSIDWIENLGPLITPRAYSGFCLIMIAPVAAVDSDYSGFFFLLKRAIQRGRPTLMQLAIFLALWAIPIKLRQRVRNLRHGQSSPVAI